VPNIAFYYMCIIYLRLSWFPYVDVQKASKDYALPAL